MVSEMALSFTENGKVKHLTPPWDLDEISE